MTSQDRAPVISVMLAVADAAAAVRWYAEALGAIELWNLGGVVGLSVEGAPFFLGEPAGNGWDTPDAAGTRTVRVEVFVDDPDGFIERAVAAGATARGGARDHQMPWGVHRQGSFDDPFGHRWLVGDRSPTGPACRRPVRLTRVGRVCRTRGLEPAGQGWWVRAGGRRRRGARRGLLGWWRSQRPGRTGSGRRHRPGGRGRRR